MKEVDAFKACFIDGTRSKHVVPKRFTFSQWLAVLNWGKKLVSFEVLRYRDRDE